MQIYFFLFLVILKGILMKVLPISFGKKIPITRCKIRDNKENKFISATFYEIDCKDEDDINEIKNLPSIWKFNRAVSKYMQDTHLQMENPKKDISKSFYEMRTDDGEIVGICQLDGQFPDLKLEYIESKRNNRYKYVGKTMMASIGKIAQHKKFKRIHIPVPIISAENFYIEKCGFKHCNDGSVGLYMRTSRAKTIEKKAEADINSKIIDLMG